MRFFYIIILFFALFILSKAVCSQEIRKDEIVVIKGEKFISHQVTTGETIYSISKRYHVTQSDLEKYNPEIKNGLSIGEMLKIPYVEGTDISEKLNQAREPDGFNRHKIKSRKETPYSIAQKYGITVEQLYRYNPKVKRYKKGVKLNIPFWIEEEVKEPDANEEEEELVAYQVASGETLYSISRKFSISQEEIIRYNSEAKNLRAGMIIYLPKTEFESITPEAIEKETAVMYFEHIIVSGETMWGITRKYGVSETELKELNPILRSGFPAGVVIKIPVEEIESTVARPVNEAAFAKHLVKRKETLYGLSKQYNLSIQELKKYNPILETRNLVYGETILIPIKNDEIFDEIPGESKIDSVRLVEQYYQVEVPVEIPHACLPDGTGTYISETYDITLFLPLFLEANDTLNREDLVVDSLDLYSEEEVMIAQDTTIELEERKELFKQFYRGTENFVQFYEGVLLAIDSLQNAGVDIRLTVFDTQRNADTIRAYVSSDEFLGTDLIIGPIYQNIQNDVVAVAAKNRIPIVSPLASQSTFTNTTPNYYQVNPSRNYLASKTASMVAEEYYNSNFIIIKTQDYSGTPEGRLVELFQEKFVNSGFMSDNEGVNFTIYDLENEGSFGLRRIMSKSKENVVYIPSSDEGKLSVAISNVNNLSDDFSITLIGSSRYPNYSSIQIDHYHNLKLRFFAPYWIDYTDSATIDFIQKYKDNFGTEPNNFGIQGYDVTMYFMTTLTTFGPDFTDCLPYMHIPLIQGNYHFEKLTQYGGYMNQGISLISYTKDYDVIRKRVVGQPRLIADK